MVEDGRDGAVAGRYRAALVSCAEHLGIELGEGERERIAFAAAAMAAGDDLAGSRSASVVIGSTIVTLRHGPLGGAVRIAALRATAERADAGAALRLA